MSAGFDVAAFVRANTWLVTPDLVPEIRLHLAEEPYELWTRVERELGSANPPPPFWAFAWPGGQGLARYVLDHPDVVARRTVLDVASGSGLVAIAAACRGASAVTATDIDPFAAAAIEINAAANGTVIDVRHSDVLAGDGEGADVVLAGDVCYDRDLAELVWPFVARARARGALVLLGDPGRAHFRSSGFRAVGRYEVPATDVLEAGSTTRTTVWQPE